MSDIETLTYNDKMYKISHKSEDGKYRILTCDEREVFGCWLLLEDDKIVNNVDWKTPDRFYKINSFIKRHKLKPMFDYTEYAAQLRDKRLNGTTLTEDLLSDWVNIKWKYNSLKFKLYQWYVNLSQ